MLAALSFRVVARPDRLPAAEPRGAASDGGVRAARALPDTAVPPGGSWAPAPDRMRSPRRALTYFTGMAPRLMRGNLALASAWLRAGMLRRERLRPARPRQW